MSYEGYEQCLCENGHYWEQDCRDEDRFCVECHLPIVWQNSVAETNVDGYGHIDMEQFKVAEAKVDACPTCKHTKEVEPARYRMPTPEETKAARTRYESIFEEGEFVGFRYIYLSTGLVYKEERHGRKSG